MADTTSNIETTYKNVEFDFGHVNLLWNCCAIVKKLLRLQEKVDELNQKFISLPDDFSDFMQETRDGLEAAANGIVDLNSAMQRVLERMTQVETDVGEATTTVGDMETTVNNLELLVNSLDGSVDALTLRVTAVEGQAATNAGNITALQTRVNNLGMASTKGVANNLTQTTSGVNVLDAYQGKLLGDRATALEARIPRGLFDRATIISSTGNVTSVAIEYPTEATAYPCGLLICNADVYNFYCSPQNMMVNPIYKASQAHAITTVYDHSNLPTFHFNANFNGQICVILLGTSAYRANITFA